MGQDGRDIRGNEVFTGPQPDHHRRAELGGDQHARFTFIQYTDGVGTTQLCQGLAHGRLKVCSGPQALFEQVGDHFRVGGAFKAVAGFDQLFLERQVVLDDAVVDDDYRPGLVGMGVDFRRPPMGGPAGVADADGPAERLLLQKIFKVDQLPLAAADGRFTAGEGCDSGRIIASVFQLLQPFKNNRGRLLPPDVSNYSTHYCFLRKGDYSCALSDGTWTTRRNSPSRVSISENLP